LKSRSRKKKRGRGYESEVASPRDPCGELEMKEESWGEVIISTDDDPESA
jgi:hypothetical protein